MGKSKDSYLQIVCRTLEVLILNPNGVKKTQILYKANFSHQMLTEYLNNLFEMELIREWKGLYYITPKGIAHYIESVRSCVHQDILKGLELLR